MSHMRTAQVGSLNADSAFRDALFCLVGLHDRIAETNFKESNILRQFREESCAELVKFENKLRAYSDVTLFIAEGANENEWHQLCIRRSIVQILLDDYRGDPVAEFIDLEDVSDLDKELRRVGLEQGPIPEDFIPNGLTESHWWWRYSRETDESPSQPVDK